MLVTQKRRAAKCVPHGNSDKSRRAIKSAVNKEQRLACLTVAELFKKVQIIMVIQARLLMEKNR